MIRLANSGDIDAVTKSYEELLTYEESCGTSCNWQKGVYPTRETAVKGCAAQTLYVKYENEVLCASMILNHDQPEAYQTIDWLYPAPPDKVLVLHTLCIPPSAAGKGLGKEMTRFALDLAKKTSCTVIRLDTWAKNRRAAGLYQSMGFRFAGSAEVMHQGVIPEEMIFFEYRLDPR
ncbi:GNAT family N-acetyltransferase [Ihubacter sp. mB4P-1]|uniref:GNAT family N-acetyltransferase n=1 Tax=Ihubacter sp. mB4P-1 TaxID=3242370 RepID=UPI003C7D90AF